jgi:transposase
MRAVAMSYQIRHGLCLSRTCWGGNARDNRLFIKEILWILRTGAPWRNLPPDYGSWDRHCHPTQKESPQPARLRLGFIQIKAFG